MKQHTIKKQIIISGIGLHGGKTVRALLKPAKAGSGINFSRLDIPGSPRIRAGLKNVSSTIRGTNIGDFQTVEHVLSALYALSVTDIDIEMDSPEPPALDGSSKIFCERILEAGIVEHGGEMKCASVKKPLFVMGEGRSLLALPSDRFKISFMIDYPVDFIGSQFYKFDLDRKAYVKEIAPARTFGFTSEIEALNKQGLALGANTNNAVAIGKDGYLTKLRFNDELVRHKILDLIGDISLVGKEIKAHIIGIRSGHRMNIELARLIEEVG